MKIIINQERERERERDLWLLRAVKTCWVTRETSSEAVSFGSSLNCGTKRLCLREMHRVPRVSFVDHLLFFFLFFFCREMFVWCREWIEEIRRELDSCPVNTMLGMTRCVLESLVSDRFSSFVPNVCWKTFVLGKTLLFFFFYVWYFFVYYTCTLVGFCILYLHCFWYHLFQYWEKKIVRFNIWQYFLYILSRCWINWHFSHMFAVAFVTRKLSLEIVDLKKS